MEKQGVSDLRFLEILVDNIRNGDRSLPLPLRMRDVRQRTAMNEGELTALEQHPAIGRREAAALGAIGDDLSDCELAGERLTLGLEVDTGCQTLKLPAARIGAAKLGNERRQVLAGIDVRLGDSLVDRPCGSSRSGMAIFGRVAFAAETSVPEGPARAGATLAAASAAPNSNAERREIKSLTENLR